MILQRNRCKLFVTSGPEVREFATYLDFDTSTGRMEALLPTIVTLVSGWLLSKRMKTMDALKIRGQNNYN